MSTNPKVSVLIPTYNRARYVTEAIESALNQTYKDIEIIVVDDGSTDNTRDVLKVYTDEEKAVYLYQQNSGKPSIARNFGLKHCTGEYIAFLDSDDILEKESISRRVDFMMENQDIGFVFSDYNVFYKGFRYEDAVKPSTIVREFTQEVIDKYGKARGRNGYYIGQMCLYELLLYDFIHTSTVIARKKLVLEENGFDETLQIAEDLDLWVKLLKKTCPGYIREPLSSVLEHESICSNTENYLSDTIAVKERYYWNGKIRFPYNFRMRNQLGKLYFSRGYYYVEKERFNLAKKDFKSAFLYNPIKPKHLKGLSYFILPPSILKSLRKILHATN